MQLATAWLAMGLATPVHAHDGGPLIIVQPPIVAPGDAINVRGDNLWTDAEVEVTLLGPDGERTPIGEGMTDGEAHLALVLTLPSDLTEGRYQVEVTDAAGQSVSASLVIGSGSSAYLIGLLALAVALLGLVIVASRVFGTRGQLRTGRR